MADKKAISQMRKSRRKKPISEFQRSRIEIFLEGKTGWRQIGRKKERKRIEYFSVDFKREGGGGGMQFSLWGELERKGILVSRKANVMVRESSVSTTQEKKSSKLGLS